MRFLRPTFAIEIKKETEDMQLQNLNLDYCFRYASNTNAEGYMLNGPKKSIRFEKGAMIAWLDVQKLCAYVVEYLRPRTYKVVSEMRLSTSDWQFINSLSLQHIILLDKGCTVANFLDMMHERYDYSNLSQYDYGKTPKDNECIEASPVEDYSRNVTFVSSELKADNLAETIQTTAQYLKFVAAPQEVSEALYVLFGTRVKQLKGHDAETDQLLTLLPESHLDEFLTKQIVDEVTQILSVQEFQLFHTSLSYHQVILNMNLVDSWHSALADCPQFADRLNESLRKLFYKENEKRRQKSKPIIVRLLNHLSNVA